MSRNPIYNETELNTFLGRMSYVPVDAITGEGFSKLKKVLGNSNAIRAFYLAVAPSLFGEISHRLKETRPDHREFPHRRRKADRARPRLGARAQRPDRRRFRRTPDLPHRPLPRQGDGAEPDGAALRQHALRAAVELGAYRPRADHRGRDGRARGPRQLLRQGGRAARHGAEPHAAAAVPGGDGAAVVDGRQCGARRKAEGAAFAEARSTAPKRRNRRCAASTGPARRRAAR